MSRHPISITDIIKKYNIPHSTINHYTIIGLLNVIDRKRNIRFYDGQEVEERLKRIAELKKQGYPLLLIQKEFSKK